MRSPTVPRPRRGGLAGVVLLALACSGNDNGTNPQTPAIDIAVSPPSLSVTQGASGTFSVAVTRSGGFADAVTLAAEGLPASVTIPNVTVAAGQTSGTMTVSAGAAAAGGTSTVTIRATGNGVTAKTAPLSLTIQAAAQPAFAMALNPATLTVAAGSSGTSTVNLTRSGGFTGAVALTATAPQGLTATFNPASATGAQSTLTVAAAASAAAGNYTVTVTGAGGTGITNQTATLTVTVTAPTPTGSFTLALNPATVSVQAGGSGTSTVNITRTAPFTGAVALTATAPAGLTVTFNPASATGAQSTATVAVAAGTAAGNYPVTITGAAAGLANQTATLTVGVTVPSSGGNVTFNFCAAAAPVWVAAQDGNGAWTRVTGTANAYSFNIASGKGGIAYVTGDATTGFHLTVLYAATAELQAQGSGACATGGAGKTVSVNVTGLQPPDLGYVGLGSAVGTASAAQGSLVTLRNVPQGTVDLVAARIAINVTDFTLTVNKLLVRRNLNPADNSTLPPVDFGSTEAFDPASRTVTLNNLGTDQAQLFASYVTANRSVVPYFIESAATSAATHTVATFPASQQAAGDLHMVFATAVPPGTPPAYSRTAGTLFGASANQTLTLGPVPAAVTVSAPSTSPYARLRAVLTVQSEYNRFWTASYVQPAVGAVRTATIMATTGYAGGGGTLTLDVPDLTGTAAWDNNWGLKAGTATSWTFTAQGWSQSGGVAGTPFAEGTFLTGNRSGTITP
ncbi:MAG TPA: hypothetical protein VFQ38_06230 [Longimicrobiales bacterium]|nr:hypothetical protein [Longimicrobiales bacterium]